MKYLLIILTVFCNICCNQPDIDYCNKTVHGTQSKVLVCFVKQDKWDASTSWKTYYFISRIYEPNNWDANEYFTGKGWSKKDREALCLQIEDSCKLKKIYFGYLKDNQ